MFRHFAAAIAMLVAGPALAEGNLSFGITGGTLGIGPQIGYRFNKQLGVRADATFLSLSHSFSSNDLHYDGHAKLESVGGSIDLYPFGGGFRVSGGMRSNGNQADATATPTQNTSIGGATFTPQQIGTLKGRAHVKDFAPQVTFGYGGKLRKALTAGIDVGVLAQGRVHISNFTSSTGMIPQARLDQERDSLQHDVSKYRVYPIAQLSFGYRF